MIGRSVPRTAAALALVAALHLAAPSPAAAWGGLAGSEQVGRWAGDVWERVAAVWERLGGVTAVWEREGAGMDPNGGQSPQGDGGLGMEPDGSPSAQEDKGAGMDPDG